VEFEDYASYEFKNNQSIIVDGNISEVDGLPYQFAPFWEPGTGHPDAYTYIYLRDDEEYVYVSADVTGDNTNEFGTDWIKVFIPNTTNGTLKEYRVDDYNDAYGKCSFGITSKVSYKHQTCEIRIPKAEIAGNNIDFALMYYGTMVAPSGSYVNNINLILPGEGDASSASGSVSNSEMFKVTNESTTQSLTFSISSQFSSEIRTSDTKTINNNGSSTDCYVSGSREGMGTITVDIDASINETFPVLGPGESSYINVTASMSTVSMEWPTGKSYCTLVFKNLTSHNGDRKSKLIIGGLTEPEIVN